MKNKLEYVQRANTLIEALPYIKKFKDKLVVIKYGGSFMYDSEIKESIMDDIALMKLVGIQPIIVHGGGKDISQFLDALDIHTEFVDGLRVTGKDAIEVTEMVLSGKINKEIVQLLQNRGMNSVGISGKDGGMIKVHKAIQGDIDLGFVGEVETVNPDLIYTLLNHDYIPIIAPIGTDDLGQGFNINADHVAYGIAKALKAEKLIYLTDTDGVYYDHKDPTSILSRLTAREIKQLIIDNIISGGMIPKVENAVEALEGGVGSVHILDGKLEHALIVELFTAAGCGTMIYKEESKDE